MSLSAQIVQWLSRVLSANILSTEEIKNITGARKSSKGLQGNDFNLLFPGATKKDYDIALSAADKIIRNKTMPLEKAVEAAQNEQNGDSSFNSASFVEQPSSVSNLSVALPKTATGGLKSFMEAYNDRELLFNTITPANSMKYEDPDIKTPMTKKLLSFQNKNVLSRRDALLSQVSQKESKLWSLIPENARDFDGKLWSAKGLSLKPKELSEKTKLTYSTVTEPNKVAALITPLLTEVNSDLVTDGFMPMGPISSTGLPLYLGRFYDFKTKRIKLLPKPKFLYNTTDWESCFTHAKLLLAYKWNQYVKAEQTIIALKLNERTWNEIVANKKKQNTVLVRRSKQLKEVLKKVQTNTFPPYKEMSELEKSQFGVALSQWDYKLCANMIETVAAKYIKEHPEMSPGKLAVWQSYTRWEEKPILTSLKNLSLWSMPSGQIRSGFNQEANKNFKNTDIYQTSLASNSIADFYTGRNPQFLLTKQKAGEIFNGPDDFVYLTNAPKSTKKKKLETGDAIINRQGEVIKIPAEEIMTNEVSEEPNISQQQVPNIQPEVMAE